MKISELNTTTACNTPRTLSLADPFTGEVLQDENGRTVDIQVYGIQSDIARNAIKERDRKYGRQTSLTEDQKEQSGAEFLAALTAGWSDNLEDDNGPLPCTRDNAIKLYKAEDWVAKQVQQFSINLSNYDPKKSTGSERG
jgi:hypothetical protein